MVPQIRNIVKNCSFCKNLFKQNIERTENKYMLVNKEILSSTLTTMPQITFFAPCRLVLWREDADDTDITEGGIDLEIIVTGSSSDGKAKVEG